MKLMKKIITITIILSFFYSGTVFALAPNTGVGDVIRALERLSPSTEETVFLGYTNDVPLAVSGIVLKIEAGFSPNLLEGIITADTDSELEKKIKVEIENFKRVADYFISFYMERAARAKSKDKKDIYESYIMMIEELKAEIGGGKFCGNEGPGRISEEKRTALSLLIEKYEEMRSVKERFAPGKQKDTLEEVEFVILEIILHLKEKIYLPAASDSADEEIIISKELRDFSNVLDLARERFTERSETLNRLISLLGEKVPEIVRQKKRRAGRAILEIVERSELAGEETIEIKRFVDFMLEILERTMLSDKLAITGDVVVVCKDVLHPIRIEMLGEELGKDARIRAIICDRGTPLSHFSIFASQEEVVAITGAHDDSRKGLFDRVNNRETLVVYGFNGKVIKNPSETTLKNLSELAFEEKVFHTYLMERLAEETKSAGGYNVKVLGNADRPHQIKAVMDNGGQGIGLVRTEYFYDRPEEPSEEIMLNIISELAVSVRANNEITIRVLDKQPDKKMKCLPGNGETGFDYYRTEYGKRVVKTELRAIYKAFLEHQNIKVMFPQVSTREDVQFALSLISEVKGELVSECEGEREELDRMKVGFMIETPAAVDNLEYILQNADFVSIGTNDLTELVLGPNIRRDNPDHAKYFVKLRPEILIRIYTVVKAARMARKEVSICGDLAKRLKFLPFLLAISDGERHLSPSMPPQFIPLANELIRSLDINERRRIFEKLLNGNITDPGEIDREAQELVDRTIQGIKSREEYIKLKEECMKFNLFYQKMAELAAMHFPYWKLGPEDGLRKVLRQYVKEPLLAVGLRRSIGPISAREKMISEALAGLIKNAAEETGLTEEEKGLIREILTQNLLSVSKPELANKDWRDQRELPLVNCYVPIHKGVIIQKMSDIMKGMGLREWLEMIRRLHNNTADLKFGFVGSDLDRGILMEIVEKYTGLEKDSIYLGEDITEIMRQADTENFVYLGNFSPSEQARLKSERVKFVQKNNTGLPIELNLCLILLGLPIDQIYKKDGKLHDEVLYMYEIFIKNMVIQKLVEQSEADEMLAEAGRSGIIKLPEIDKVKEILEGMERAEIDVSV